MTDFDFEIIDEDDVVVSRRGGGKGKSKLPVWEPVLSWTKPNLSDKFWKDRGYGDLTEEDYEEVAKIKAVALAKQHAYIDRELEIWGIRSRTVLEIRNQKEVKVKL